MTESEPLSTVEVILYKELSSNYDSWTVKQIDIWWQETYKLHGYKKLGRVILLFIKSQTSKYVFKELYYGI